MTNALRKGLRGLIRTTGAGDNPPSGQRALIPKSDGWYDRDSAGVETNLNLMPTYKVLASTQANSTTTAASATGLEFTSVAAGTYLFTARIVYQSAATATGIQLYNNFTGTVTRLVSTWSQLGINMTADTGDQISAAGVAAAVIGKGQAANNVASGASGAVANANSDLLIMLEGVMVVTATGTLQFMFNSEVAASAVTLQIGSTATLTKVA